MLSGGIDEDVKRAAEDFPLSIELLKQQFNLQAKFSMIIFPELGAKWCRLHLHLTSKLKKKGLVLKL